MLIDHFNSSIVNGTIDNKSLQFNHKILPEATRVDPDQTSVCEFPVAAFVLLSIREICSSDKEVDYSVQKSEVPRKHYKFLYASICFQLLCEPWHGISNNMHTCSQI